MADDSKPKPLKELQKEIPSREEVLQRLAMAQLAEDYEATMLSASLLEYMLRQAIATIFIPLGKARLESIFSDGGRGPLSTFSAKIQLAYALDIVSAETRLQIERIQDVRNHFAHLRDRVSFEHPSIKTECAFFKQSKLLIDEQKALRSGGLTPKLMYVQTCFFVTMDLSQYISRLGSTNPMQLPIDCF